MERRFAQILFSESAQIRSIRRYLFIFSSEIRAYPRNLRPSAFYPVFFVYHAHSSWISEADIKGNSRRNSCNETGEFKSILIKP